jgi:hypothetical protein
MARERTTDSRRQPVGFREGYQGKKLFDGVKLVPVKSPAADVPVKSPSSNVPSKGSKDSAPTTK